MKNPPSPGNHDPGNQDPGDQDPGIQELSRREFLRLGLLASAALAKGRFSFAAEETHPGVTYYGALQQLSPGAVRPEGWLRYWLEKQAAELGSKLPQISWPFSDAYWAGEETADSWWPCYSARRDRGGIRGWWSKWWMTFRRSTESIRTGSI